MAIGTIRIGVVSTVNEDTGLVRATMTDMDNMVTPEMPLLTSGSGWALSNSTPEPGDNVLCIQNELGDWFCLGSVYDGSYDLPAYQNEHGTYFEDGSNIYYEKDTGSLIVNVKGDANITCNSLVINAPTITINSPAVFFSGNVTVNGTIKELGNPVGGE